MKSILRVSNFVSDKAALADALANKKPTGDLGDN
jgi:hypothetical protein